MLAIQQTEFHNSQVGLIIILFTILFSYSSILPLIVTLSEFEPTKIENVAEPKKEESNEKIINDPKNDNDTANNEFNINRQDIELFILIVTLILILASQFTTPNKNIRFLSQIYMFFALPFKKEKFKRMLRNRYSNIVLPFRAEKEPLLMEDVFITLFALNQPKESLTYEVDNGLNEKIDEILNKNRRCVILGAPGSGKSLLCKNLIYRYSNNTLSIESDNVVPVLVEVHKLTCKEDIYGEILKFFDFINISVSVINSLKDKGKLLIMFDGFDEIRKKDKKWIVLGIKNFIKKTDQCKFIITCRASVYQDEFDSIIDRKYMLKDFDEKQIRQYLMAWGKNKRHRVEYLISTLHKRPNIKKLAGNPLQLAIIAYLVIDREEQLPHSRGKFYSLVSEYLLGNPQKSSSPGNDFENGIEALKRIALFMHKSKKSNIKEIDKFTILEIIENSKLPYVRKDVEDFFNDVIIPSSIIYKTNKKKTIYKFFHDSFREYLVALHYLDKPKKLLRKFERNEDSWREVLKFWCCLTKRDITSFILDTFSVEPLLTLDCLGEAAIIDVDRFRPIIEKYLNFESVSESKIDRVTKSLGTIVANFVNPDVKHQLGSEILSDLKNKVDNSKSTVVLKAAVNTLSFSAIEESAKVLIDNFEKDEIIFKALENMGYLAVPFLVKIAENGETKAIDCLFRIGTEEALFGLVDLISKKDNIEISSKAAWLISNKESFSSIERLLSEESNYDTAIDSEGLNFVWEPFDNGNKSLTFKTANRIAYLINESSPPKLLPVGFEMDERISIPIALENRLVEKVSEFGNFENLSNLKSNLYSILGYTNEKIRISLIRISSEKPTPTKEMWVSMYKKSGSKDYYEYKYSLEYFISTSLIFLLIPGIYLTFIGIKENVTTINIMIYYFFIFSILHYCVISMFQINISRLFNFNFNFTPPVTKFKIDRFGFSSIMSILTFIFILSYVISKSNSVINGWIEAQGYLLINFAIIIIADLTYWGKYREYQSLNPLRKLLNTNLKQQ